MPYSLDLRMWDGIPMDCGYHMWSHNEMPFNFIGSPLNTVHILKPIGAAMCVDHKGQSQILISC